MNVDEIKPIIKRLPRLLFGFSLCALGSLMMLYTDLGMNSWGILHKGISIQTGLTFGRVIQLIGLAVILINIPLGIIPGIGTLLDMYFVGFFIDIIDATGLLFVPETFLGKLLLLFLSICINSQGIYLYLSAGLGAGARDGLMLGLMKKFNKPASIIKTGIEVTVLIVGVILGGPLGIGTIIITFCFGYTLEMAFKLGKCDMKNVEQRNLKEDYLLLFRHHRHQIGTVTMKHR